MDSTGPNASGKEPGDLVFDQCDERADHESRPAPSESRHLITEAFTCPGRHDDKCVPALGDGLADGLLAGTKLGVAEARVENFEKHLRA